MVEVLIQGHLGKDAQERETQRGSKFAVLSVGSSDFIGGEQKTQWFDCLWFDYNQKMLEHMKKGSGVNIVGALDACLETGQNGATYIRRRVYVHNVTFNSNGTRSKQDESGTNVSVGVRSAETNVNTNASSVPPKDVEVAQAKPVQKFSAVADEESDLPF